MIFKQLFANHSTGKPYVQGRIFSKCVLCFPKLFKHYEYSFKIPLSCFRVAVGKCAQYHWLCYDQETEEDAYVEGWLKYWDTQLKGYQPVSIKKCHNYVAKTTGTVRMFRGNGK